jgi:hypothetical protein
MMQPKLFKETNKSIDDKQLVLYALGNFQARGKILAERELPLDRLRGALRRAAEAFGIEEINDERAVSTLIQLGAHIKRVPTFVAKHPYRVTIPTELAEEALQKYNQSTDIDL